MKLTVTPEMVGERLDVAIMESTHGLSRAFVQKLCKQGDILVNNEPVDQKYKLKTDDSIHIDYDFNEPEHMPIINLPILYEDDDCVVIEKPIGVLSHSKGNFNAEATVATWLHDRVTGLSGDRAGIVHRLDRATSGVMICAKNPQAVSWLQKQFSQRKVKKTYIALVNGVITPEEAIIDMPIERNPKAPATFRVGANGKPAKTHYRVLKTSSDYTLLELTPETGRTHQLRVHLKKLGHPIVGDNMYGGEVAERLFLHALNLELTLPNKSRIKFTAKLPMVFKKKMASVE